jgi:hypothetical protein
MAIQVRILRWKPVHGEYGVQYSEGAEQGNNSMDERLMDGEMMPAPYLRVGFPKFPRLRRSAWHASSLE